MQIEVTGMSVFHTVCLKIIHMVEMVILHTTHTRDGKIEDLTTMQHYSDHHIQSVISEAFTIGGQTGQVIGFITSIHMSIPIISFMHITLSENSYQTAQNARKQFLRSIIYQPS